MKNKINYSGCSSSKQTLGFVTLVLVILFSSVAVAQRVSGINSKGTKFTTGNVITEGAAVPTTPISGDIWFDTSTNSTKVYDASSTTWKEIDADLVTTDPTAPATPARGDIWLDTSDASNTIPKVWDGTLWKLLDATKTGMWEYDGTNAKLKTLNDGTTARTDANNIFVDDNGNMGLGTPTPISKLHLAGSLAAPTLAISANTTLDNTHVVVMVDASAGDVTLTLPAAAAATGRIYNVIKTDNSNNNIVFSVAIMHTGGITLTTTNIPGAHRIQSDGTNWVYID